VTACRFANVTLEVGERPDGAAEVVLRGELDLEDAARVDAALAAVQAGAPVLVLNLREVTFIDSSGARVIWAGHVRARDAGGRLTVLVAPGAVRRALALTGLDGELNVVETPGG
jgi:anti-anti-sigma factor